MTNTPLSDQAHRQQALDTDLSCIVQAPAGSGKTELLTLRYLKLLCLCEQPEEVLAITFTRKAASEMRNRILLTLQRARQWQQDGIPDNAEALALQRHAIAEAVLSRNTEKRWRLLDNPARLRVQTIDSLCHYLASQLPVLSRIGGAPNVSEDVDECFQDAIDNTLAKLDGDNALARDIARVLMHLDNDRNRVQRLLLDLLHKRDQWLSYVLELRHSPDQARHYLQASLDELITETLSTASTQLAAQRDDLLDMLNFAQKNDPDQHADNVVEPVFRFPTTALSDLPVWQRLTDLLLTQQNQFRKTVDKRQGFPAGKKGTIEGDMKSLMLELLAQFSEDETLLQTLVEVRLLPIPEFEDQQWQFLVSLLQLLSELALELQLSFRRFGRIDHSQTSAAARAALGSPDDPTDIALALDHSLQHILVDEFQDTSRLQLELLQQLTAGWEPGDGRSLFLVGDAMQSCYSFRNANVGIYLDVRERGINELPVAPLTLSANFRSQAGIVEWVNDIFAGAFPAHANASRGAVPYSPSSPVHPRNPDQGVSVNLIRYGEQQRDLALILEADQVIARIRQLQQQDPDASIAILARARSHFSTIIPALRSAGIAWQATEIDSLASVPVVEDLLSLGRALINPADRLAWLSVLRAPWCGLDARALLSLCQSAGSNSMLSTLQDEAALARLESDSLARLRPVIEILLFGFSLRGHCGLREVVEACWTLLRGIDCGSDRLQQECIARFFELLEEQETAGSLDSLERFTDKLNQAWVPPAADADPGANTESRGGVQLLTMHKSKGLEFDHVILPGLSLGTGSDDKPLLQWHERLNARGESKLFLAGLTATGQDDDKLYQYIRAEQKIKNELESTRLLYIAVTRAIKSASLFASLGTKDDEVKPPPGNSLLARIWPQLETRGECLHWLDVDADSAAAHQAGTVPTQANTVQRFEQPITLEAAERALLDWQLAGLAANIEQDDSADAAPVQAQDEEQTADPLAALTGELIHQALESYTRLQDKQRFEGMLDGLRRYWRRQLHTLALTDDKIDQQCQVIEQQVQRCVTDSASAWLFQHDHEDSQCELPLLSVRGGIVKQYVVDRSFIDGDGVRWIIDYKTGQPGADMSESEFIDQQLARHRAQLDNYRQLFAAMDSRPVRTGLYLTALSRLAEYD